MRFKILSHAGISISETNHTLVIDPWLIGSCYWRSWWNFPEIDKESLKTLEADSVYLTHLHWDHFHGDSLKKFFKRDTHFFVPKVLTNRMVDDLNYLGFNNVTEISHGRIIKISDGIKIRSYQFGPGVDSALMISTKNYNILNANDCKTFGLTLSSIKRDYPSIDFTFRSHSSATAVPYCINSYDKDYYNIRTQKDYAEEFSAFCLSLNTKYAIPFASNHCFVHKDTEKYNKFSVNPKMIKPIFTKMKNETNYKSELVIMPPGSTWDSTNKKFKIRNFDYTNPKAYLNKIKRENQNKLNKQYELESETIANYSSFKKYFEKMIQSLPFFYKKTFKKPIVFEINDSECKKYWLVDFAKNIVSEYSTKPKHSIIINTPAIVINDCTEKKMFSVWTASKRLIIELPEKNDLKLLNKFFMALDLFELERFPIKNNFNFRGLGNSILRWREIITGFNYIIKYKIFRKKLVIKNLYL